jgi:hypothetical protein
LRCDAAPKSGVMMKSPDCKALVIQFDGFAIFQRRTQQGVEQSGERQALGPHDARSVCAMDEAQGSKELLSFVRDIGYCKAQARRVARCKGL